MRAEEQRRPRGIASAPPPDDVPREVDARLDARLAHPSHHHGARLPIGLAVRQPGNAAPWIASDARQRRHPTLQPGAVDAHYRLPGFNVSYSGCAGASAGSWSATVTARMRTCGSSGSTSVVAPAGTISEYANR